MNPPIKWLVSFEVKISILVMCIKAITQFWIIANFSLFSHSTTESNRDLRYDVFKLLYDVYFQSEYRDAIKATASIDWGCSTCDAPQFGITALSEISPDACLYILGTRAWSPGCLQK